jgi:isoamylase
VAYNTWFGDVSSALPPPPAGKQWFRAMDTSLWMESAANFAQPGSEEPLPSLNYKLGARAVLLAIAR